MTRSFSAAAAALAAVLLLSVTGCNKKGTPTSPSETAVFTTQISPANEVPPIINAEAGGNGNVTISLFPTRDASGSITSATMDVQVSLVAFPNGTALTSAHLHRGGVGEIGNVVLDTGLSPGEVILVNGSSAFVRTGIAIAPQLAAELMNAPTTFYFDVHSVLNGNGMARGQLIRQQ
jgi:hypothetical protein